MKKIIAISMIFIIIFTNTTYNVIAYVTKGDKNNVINSDYVVIVNTSSTETQSTGKITFDQNNSSNDNNVRIGKEVNTQSENLDEDLNLQSKALEENLNSNNQKIETLQAKEVRELNSIENRYNIGDKKSIGYNVYTLIGVGNKSYIWMEDGLKSVYDKVAGKTDLAAKEMIRVYEGQPYKLLNELADNNIPYLDNSGKLSIFLEVTKNNSTGYYANENDITGIHINTQSDPNKFNQGGFDNTNGLLVHEGQHALFNILACKQKANKSTSLLWFNEGMSVATMDYLWGYSDTNGWLSRINNDLIVRNGTSLIYDKYRNSTVQDYSMQYLFVRYLASQATKSTNPMEFFKAVYKVDAAGKTAEEFINELTYKIDGLKGRNFKEIIKSFYVAILAQEKTGIYSFYGDPVIPEKIKNYPIYMGESGKAVKLEKSGAIIVKTKDGKFTIPKDAGNDIKFFGVTKDLDTFKPSEGNGTSNNPYVIKNVQELNALGKYPNAYFKLGNDIDVKPGQYFSVENFYGKVEGNGHTINGLNKPLIRNNYGKIKNLKINANFNGEYQGYIGSVAEVNNGTIMDIEVNGNFNMNLYTANKFSIPTFGGVVGINQPAGSIERVSFNGNANIEMTVSDAIIGGIVGYNQGKINNSYSKGSIVVNQNNYGSYNLKMGGIIGCYKSFGIGSSLKNSYSIISLTYNNVNNNNISNDINSIINNNTFGKVGQLIGSLESTSYILNSYGLDKISPIGNNPTATEYKRTLAQLQNKNTFINWDFTSVWKMGLDGDKTPVFLDVNKDMKVSAKLSKDTYFIGEKLSLGNAKLIVDGVSIPLEESMINVSEFDSTVAGTKVIHGNYKGNAFTVTYNIKKPKLIEDLQVVNEGKVTYSANQEYSAEDVVLKAKLDGQQYYTYIYSGFKSNLSRPLKPTDKSVKLTYVNKSVDININVIEKKVTSISVYNRPNKTSYKENELLDLTGSRFQLTYNDGSRSEIFGPNDLSKYNLHIAQSLSSSYGSEALDLNNGLTVKNNNGRILYVYYNSVLPGQSGAVFASLGRLNVTAKISMENGTFRAVLGQRTYLWSEPLLNANYDVTTTVKSGKLPDGITATSMPNNRNTVFTFEGTATKAGKYQITYTITRNNGDSIDVTFTFNVEGISNEAFLDALTLKKAHNNHLLNDIEGVIDNNNNTIIFYVPNGTDITKLKPTPTYHKGSTLPTNRWNGCSFDFTKGPIDYKVTAEDGITTKTYMVSVVVLPLNN